MGVKDLWNILSPLCDKKPLYELQGKTVAIDLSGWIIDSQTIVDNTVQPKIYLRNLYFRTAFLLMQGIFPVFVLEGKAPVLKHNTIAQRNDARNKTQEKKGSSKGGRAQFNRILNECKIMLKHMGIACVQSHGEAEAMCAYLNEDGLVDGCISQDSDCFLYGAKVVYRNFCTSTQGNHGATAGSVDIYNIEKIKKILNIGRNKMIALALLCGCDYDKGINGVGKEAALKFFKTVTDESVLRRIQEWRTDTSLDRIEIHLSNSNMCTSCGHQGKLQKHTKSGCADCGTIRKCNDDFRDKRTLMLNEISLRKKALCDENFPNQELMEEFLVRKNSIPSKLDIEWKQPQINEFIDFMNKYLCWEPQYAFEKIFTLTTRWQLLHLSDLTFDERLSIPNLFIPDEIKKIRNIRSTASYEIIWKKKHSAIEMLKEYKKQTQTDSDNDDDNLLTSIEPQNLVLKCYPQLVKEFEDNRNVKAKKRTANSRRKKSETNTETKGTAISRQKKERKKTVQSRNNRKIDEFVSRNNPISLEESFERIAITPKKSKREHTLNKVNELEMKDVPENCTIMGVKPMKQAPQFKRILEIEKINSRLNNSIDRMFNELSPDDFTSESEENELNITDVIDDICSKQILQFNTNCRPTERTNQFTENVTEESTKVDGGKILISDLENDPCAENEEKKSDSSDDEFDDIIKSYVPINQRIQIEENKKVLRIYNWTEKESQCAFEDIMNETDDKSVNLDA